MIRLALFAWLAGCSREQEATPQDSPFSPPDTDVDAAGADTDADAPADSGNDTDSASDTDTDDLDIDLPDPDDCLADEEFFARYAAPMLGAECAACHREGGVAGSTRYRLGGFDTPEQVEANRININAFLTGNADARDLFWQKPTNTVSHGGGKRFDVLDPEYALIQEVIARAFEPGNCELPEDASFSCEPGRSYPGETPLRRLTDQQVEHAITDLLGVTIPSGVFPKTVVAHGFRSFPDNNAVSAAGAEQIVLAAEAASARVTPATLRRCDAGESDAACDARTLRKLAERAFRRPLTTDEAALVTRFVGTGLPRDDVYRHSIEQLLQLPQFLYVDAPSGAPVADGYGVVHLEDYAIATRMGLLYLDSLPDAALLEAASVGALHTRTQVQEHARRLLGDPRTSRAVVAFHEDWLRLGRLDGMVRDATAYPEFESAWIDDLRTETRLFTTEVLWSGDARFATLMSSRTTWVNPTVAALYGIDAPGAGWSRVTLDAQRPGVLTRAAFLSAHAYSASSSPVRRGAWVLEQLLCEELSPPPGVNMDLPKDSEAAPTVRERLLAHWTDPTCSACHTRIDPSGLAFEHYGALGEYRTHWENGHVVDASGTLEDPAVTFDGAPVLLEALRDSPRVRACYAQRWFEYAIGRSAETEDACSLRTLTERFEASGGNIRGLLLDVSLTDAFLHRHPPELP
jgi:hypothetical protein